MLMDILIGQKFEVKSVAAYDQILKEGFYIFDDSPSTLTYFDFDESIIGLKANKHGLVLNGWIDFESGQCIGEEDLISKVKAWHNSIQSDKKSVRKFKT